MIFEETDTGLTVYIDHKELMNDDKKGFVLCVLKGRQVYRCHYADMDDDNSDGE